jgi:hypothetical protein
LITFKLRYFLFAVLLFITEVLIALYVNDRIIRPYIGDVLVVILIYCAVKTFLHIPVFKAAICVWIFALLVETLQYFNFVSLLGLKHNKLANVVLGNYFAWMDIAAYTVGLLIILLAEKHWLRK